MTKRPPLVTLMTLVALMSPGRAQAPDAAPKQTTATRGDLRRVHWVRPWTRAQEEARRTGRPILCKPILGGSNTPDPEGVPCGGKGDCEGSW